MPLVLEIAGEADFPEIIAGQWEAFENPYNSASRLFYPIVDNDRAASLVTITVSQLDGYRKSQPESVWIKVVDTEADNRIAGAALWKIHPDRNPFERAEGEEEKPFEADWVPEGLLREFATRTLGQMFAPRAKLGQRPQAYLNIAYTLPAYRRRGVGDLFMKWGVSKADELGLECWLDASDLGRPLYEKHGFVPVVDHFLTPQAPAGLTEAEQAEWKQLEEEVLPMHEVTMWRPTGGNYVEGVTVKPWDVEEENKFKTKPRTETKEVPELKN